jgi:hypothetical protein
MANRKDPPSDKYAGSKNRPDDEASGSQALPEGGESTSGESEVGSPATATASGTVTARPLEPHMVEDVLATFTRDRDRTISLDPFGTPARGRPGNLLLVEPPRGEVDGFVLDATNATAKSFGGMEMVEKVGDILLAHGDTENIARLTERLNRAALDRVPRLLLSLPGVYATLVEEALDRKIPLEDTAGLFGYVLRRVEDRQGGPRVAFAQHVVDFALASRRMTISDTKRTLVIEAVRTAEIPTRASKALALVLQAVEVVGRKALARAAVEWYAERGEVDPRRFTAGVKRAMTDYLSGHGVQFTAAEFESGKYDEYLAIAYDHAIRSHNGGSADPVDVVRKRGAVVDWDFRVETFDSVEEQGVVAGNIRAAGALDYLFQLGDRMGIFRLLDAFTLAWGRGDFDLESMPLPASDTEDVQALMFRYHKLRGERVSPEERAMLYRRVLDKGPGELLGGTQANRAFTALWTKLMTEVADYIRRNEESPAHRKAISRQRVYEAIRQIQINLSERMAGMARLQVTEMYHQFLEAKAILESEQMLNYYGAGPRRSIWTVIERGKRELLSEQDNLSAMLTVAVEGNKVFQLLADFDPATFTDTQFDELADACEAVIIAESVLAGLDDYRLHEDDEVEDDWEDDEDDDFDGWDD